MCINIISNERIREMNFPKLLLNLVIGGYLVLKYKEGFPALNNWSDLPQPNTQSAKPLLTV